MDLVAKSLNDIGLGHFEKITKKICIWLVSVQSLRPRRIVIFDVNYIHGKLLNEHKQCESQDKMMSQALC